MVDLLVFDSLPIQSYQGAYEAHFSANMFSEINATISEKTHFIVDENIAKLYQNELKSCLSAPSILFIHASEESKSLEKIPYYIKHLIDQGVRRHHTLIAIGGGIVQDITAFLSTVLMRGIDWHFYPTTLLAQADSCIGSKSSINAYGIKNILGTFMPPKKIIIDTQILETLSEIDFRSGIGEILKIHLIEGLHALEAISNDYGMLKKDKKILQKYIYASLKMKKKIIEEDEFDKKIRNILNYGHSFGHAIESATQYAIPHGIAVTLGIDMANYLSLNLGELNQANFDRIHKTLAINYQGFEKHPVSLDTFLNAISKDKKNSDNKLKLILNNDVGKVEIIEQENNLFFKNVCERYLNEVRC